MKHVGMMKSDENTIREIKIPVPWGHIAAKVWGNEEDIPILTFHGILDNAGSFDGLIPLLLNSFCYICIDLPGHGLSSHFPVHLPIYSLSYIVVYKLIADYFKSERYIIMGHSYGAQLGLLFTQLYPQRVQKLIMLETVSLYPVEIEQFKDYLVHAIDSHILLEEKLITNYEPTYTYEEALQKLKFGRRYNYLTTKAATALLQRTLIPDNNNDRYKFSHDQRLKNFINPLRDFRHIIETLKHDPVTCPVLMILGTDSLEQQLYMKPLIKHFKALKNFSIKSVDGNHDVHNINPEVVAPHVNKFLLRRGKL